ncbi:putative aminoglycoside phosphotransferase [Burkholderia sp. H160]|nr:putative aminoglycoside phosphotransferase [Burkholderia sp. H160]
MCDSSVQDEALEKQKRDRKAIAEWVERNLGGKVKSISLLFRQRISYRVDYEVNGETRTVIAKGRRPWENIPYSLDYEMEVNKILKAQGLPIPQVYGMMENPKLFFMEWVDSDPRDPGLMQQASDNPSGMSAERWEAAQKYIDQLARLHALPVSLFADLECGMPKTAEDIALNLYRHYYQFLVKRNAVDAKIEFVSRWLKRNVPQHRTKPAFVAGDAAQFLAKGTEIAALLDFELGYIGDPLQDLACYRGRHPAENLGDLPTLFRRYAQVTGEPVDKRVVGYHTVQFLAMSGVGVMTALTDKAGDFTEAMFQIAFIMRRCYEAVAELEGVALEEVMPPEPHRSMYADVAIERLTADIREIPTSEYFQPWQREVMTAMPKFLSNYVSFGPWLEREDLNDISELLGRRFDDVKKADDALKAFIEQAGPEYDAKLIRLIHRQMQRLCHLCAGPGAPKDALFFVKVEPVLTMEL